MTTCIQCCCPWCGARFIPRVGGRPQRFCCVGHRRQYHSAARRYVDREIAAGRLTIATLRESTATRALDGATETNVRLVARGGRQ